jgi:hypothetical protein
MPDDDGRSHAVRRLARPTVRNLTVASSLLGSLVLAADEPTPDQAHTPLTSVSKRESYVFASTPDGLFRASLETKRWERLKTPPEMPLNGTFAWQMVRSPLIIYVTHRSKRDDQQPLVGDRYGLYLSHDDGATWKLASGRDDLGTTLHLPNGALFAVSGADGINSGRGLLRSTDLGETWRDITGITSGMIMYIEPDPAHPGLVRIHAWAGTTPFLLVADDENYRWRVVNGREVAPVRRSGADFFSRASSGNRLYIYEATFSNYFQYDFGDAEAEQAFEVVPFKARFEFARGARAVVPVRVVFHYDPDVALARWRKAVAEGRPLPKPTPPTEKFADQPEGTEFWGLRVETANDQYEKFPTGGLTGAISSSTAPEGKTLSSRSRAPAADYKLFDLSPSSPYERELDLGRLADFSKPGEYRVQIIYSTGGHTHTGEDRSVWDGHFTSPVFTVVIQE